MHAVQVSLVQLFARICVAYRWLLQPSEVQSCQNSANKIILLCKTVFYIGLSYNISGIADINLHEFSYFGVKYLL